MHVPCVWVRMCLQALMCLLKCLCVYHIHVYLCVCVSSDRKSTIETPEEETTGRREAERWIDCRYMEKT